MSTESITYSDNLPTQEDDRRLRSQQYTSVLGAFIGDLLATVSIFGVINFCLSLENSMNRSGNVVNVYETFLAIGMFGLPFCVMYAYMFPTIIDNKLQYSFIVCKALGLYGVTHLFKVSKISPIIMVTLSVHMVITGIMGDRFAKSNVLKALAIMYIFISIISLFTYTDILGNLKFFVALVFFEAYCVFNAMNFVDVRIDQFYSQDNMNAIANLPYLSLFKFYTDFVRFVFGPVWRRRL